MKWIDINKRKPEIGSIVMVYIDKNYRGHNPSNYAFCQYSKYGFDMARVTHWKPLPEPPK